MAIGDEYGNLEWCDQCGGDADHPSHQLDVDHDGNDNVVA